MNAEVSVPGVEGRRGDEPDTAIPSLRTGLKITAGLAATGGVCGAGVGVALTYLGNVLSGYPIPPSAGIYAWNASIMAGIGATLGPPMVWSLLRRVPLWRTLLEPAVAAVAASALSMRFAPSFFLAAVPLSVTAAALRLRWAYRHADSKTLSSGDDEVPLIADSAKGQAPELGDIP